MLADSGQIPGPVRCLRRLPAATNRACSPATALGAPARSAVRRAYRVLALTSRSRRPPFHEIERIDQVIEGVDGPHPIANIDVEPAGRSGGGHHNLYVVYTRLPGNERFLDIVFYQRHRRHIQRLEDQRIQARAEVRTHDALTRRCAEDDPYSLANILFISGQGDFVRPIHLHGERQPDTEKRPVVRPIGHSAQPPIRTFIIPTTIGAPQPDTSPISNAGRPPISTVKLPRGNGVGGCGPAGGGKAHVCRSPTTAAGIPPMSTVGTPGPVMTPGCPVGSPTRAAGGMVCAP